METYKEVKHLIRKKGNAAIVKKLREKPWQTTVDQLNVYVVQYVYLQYTYWTYKKKST